MAGHTRLSIAFFATVAISLSHTAAQPNSTSTCLQTLALAPQFSKFVTYLSQASLVPGLSDAIANSASGITLFAPVDSAWTGLSPNATRFLTTPANVQVLQSLLFSHAVGQSLQAAQFTNNETLISLSGEPLLIMLTSGLLQVDGFPVTQPDIIVASDCVVHGFGGVIVPFTIPLASGLVPTTPPLFGGPVRVAPAPAPVPVPAPAPAPVPVPAPQPEPAPAPAPSAFPCSTILETAVNTGRYRQLIQVLQATGLDLAIRTLTIPVTIFAPSDNAFNALTPALLSQLGANADTLQRILLYHVAEGFYPADALRTRGNLSLSSALQGLPIPVSSQNQTSILVGFPGSVGVVTEPDLALVSPVCALHGISSVLIPPGFFFPGAPGPAPSQMAPNASQNTTSAGSGTTPGAPRGSASTSSRPGLAAIYFLSFALVVATALG